MSFRFGRAVGLSAVSGFLVTLAATAFAGQETRVPENSLVGITLLKSSYRDVLRRFGRPDEIQAGGPYLPNSGVADTARPSGGGEGGGAIAPGGGKLGGGAIGGGGGGKRAISRNGFPGKSGTGAAGPGAGALAPGGPAGAGPGLPGFAGGGGSSPYGGGAYGGGSSPYGGPAGPGGFPGQGTPPGGVGSPDAAEDQSEYEATWWYNDKLNGLHLSFLFNKEGRVIQIQEYGHDKKRRAGKTKLGITLGSNMNQVLRGYGWSNDGENDGSNVILRYGGERKVAFQLVNNIVVGITVAVVNSVPPVEPAN